MGRVILIIQFVFFVFALQAQSYLTKILLPENIQSTIDKSPRNFLKNDKMGNTWIGFGGQKTPNGYFISPIGLAKLTNDTPWTVYNTSNSDIVSNDVTSIDFQNNITWIGSNSGLIKFDGIHFSVFNSKNSGLASDTIKDVSVSGTTIWLATNKGVSKFDGNTFTNFDTSNCNFKTNMCTKIIGTSSSSAYVGSNIGLFKINGSIVTHYNTNNSGLLLNVITALHIDINNTLWISTDKSALDTVPTVCIHYLKDGVLRNLGLDDLSFNSCATYLPYVCRSIASDKFGNIYFLSANNQDLLRTPRSSIFKFFSNNITIYNGTNFYDYFGYPNFIEIAKDGNILVLAGSALAINNNYSYLAKINLDSANIDRTTLFKKLDINSVSNAYSTLDRSSFYLNTIKGYETPKGSCKSTITASSLWVGGITQGKMRLAAQTYNQNGDDYFAGPLDTLFGNMKLSNQNDTNIVKQNNDELSKIWKINKWEINSLKANYTNGNIANGSYKIPIDILTWPTRGKGRYNRNYAPFIDADSDGIYNPHKGDYPEIKGDQMLYAISNDADNVHYESGGLPMGIEIQASYYAYKCDDFADSDSNVILNYTTFTQYEIFNRSTNTYDSVRVGIWTDNSIGNYADDFVGCNPKENYSFCYNGDDFDEGAMGYGLNPPVSSTLLLKTPTDENNNEVGFGKFIKYYNDFSTIGNPQTPFHYFNYLNGKWKDGSSLTYGGRGCGLLSVAYNTGIGATVDTASFMYPGSNDLAGRVNWTEETSGNKPTDIICLNSTNMFSFKPGEKKTIEYATLHTRANRNNWKSQMAKDIAIVKRWYKDNSFPSCGRNSIGINDKLNTNSNSKIRLNRHY